MGMMDVGAFVNLHETPLTSTCPAKTGMKFNYGYAANWFAHPPAAKIMTGRHPVRVDITDSIPGHQHIEGPSRTEQPRSRGGDHRRGIEAPWIPNSRGSGTLAIAGIGRTDQGFDFNAGGHHRAPPGGYYAPWNNPV